MRFSNLTVENVLKAMKLETTVSADEYDRASQSIQNRMGLHNIEKNGESHLHSIAGFDCATFHSINETIRENFRNHGRPLNPNQRPPATSPSKSRSARYHALTREYTELANLSKLQKVNPDNVQVYKGTRYYIFDLNHVAVDHTTVFQKLGEYIERKPAEKAPYYFVCLLHEECELYVDKKSRLDAHIFPYFFYVQCPKCPNVSRTMHNFRFHFGLHSTSDNEASTSSAK